MNAGLGLRLHHVGYVVKTIEAAAGQYATRFGYEIVTDVIHDLVQTALVQFLRLPGDTSYLELVAPDGEGSRLSAEAARGRPLHHLCFVADDLDGAILRLRDKGMVLISEAKPAVALGGRRICWMMGSDRLPVELLERRSAEDVCVPGRS